MRALLNAILLLASSVCTDGGSGGGIGSDPNNPPPTEPPATNRVSEGVFSGVRTNLVSGKLEQVYMTFLADGRVIAGLPKEGMDVPVDWERECHTAKCGTHTRSGNQVVMQWQGGSGTETFRLDSQGVLYDSNSAATSYRRIQLMDGTLEGRYAIGGSEPDGPSTEITFQRNGQFTDVGVMYWTAWDEASGLYTSFRGGPGRYTIKRGTLRLTYDNGQTATRFILVPPGGTVEEGVRIGSTSDYRRMR